MGLSNLQGCLVAGGNQTVEQMGQGQAETLTMTGGKANDPADRNQPWVSIHQILDQGFKGLGGRVGGAVAGEQKGGPAGAAFSQQVDALPRIGGRIHQEVFELLPHKLFHGRFMFGIHFHQVGQDPVGPKVGAPGPVGYR